MKNKWLIALATVGIHISIGSVYAWSVLVKPIIEACGFGLSEVTFVFSLAIFFLGLSASTLGKYVDKYGPGKTGLAAAIAFGSGMVLSAVAIQAQSLPLLYLSYGVILGIGLGLGYVTPVSTLVKSFPSHPGLASGIAIMGFGFGAVVASPVMQTLILSVGLVKTLFILGCVYCVIMLLSALYLGSGVKVANKESDEKGAMKPREVYSTWQFRALFAVFYINITCGIGLLAVISPMCQELFGATAVAAAAFVGMVGLINGISRLAWASMSDIITRRWTYVIFFIMEAFLFVLLANTDNEYVFKLAVLLIISCYGGGFSCMPPYLSDLFGKEYLSTIHGRILFAWGLAGLTGPLLIALSKDIFNSYEPVLYLFAGSFVLATGIADVLRMHQNTYYSTEVRA